MFMSTFSRLATALSVLALICSTSASPLPSVQEIKAGNSSILSAITGPRFVVYGDRFNSNGAPAAAEIAGWNVFALSFWLSSGPADNALQWTTLTDAQRASIKADYAAAGISLVVSAFGSTDLPTSGQRDPTATAQAAAAFVKKYNLDGIDVDYEDLTAMNIGTGPAWLITFTQVLRSELPQGQFIITHAPLAPWFDNSFPNGGYVAIDKQVGSSIDWYNIQFYNQGVTEYTTCDNLLNTSGGTFPNSALFEISKSITSSVNKLVIGKPATTADASNGFIDPGTLATCVSQAKSKGWNAGIMSWQFPNATPQWIKTVRGTAFP